MIIQTDKPIRVVPADQALPIEMQDLKVAIYARVSSQQDKQHGSLANQVGGCMDLINKYPSWELTDIYSETVSGKKTSTKTRKEFSRLIRDIKKGRVNLVLTKSISRFSRNTLTTLENLAILKHHGVNIIFDKEKMNFFEEDFMHLAIMASFAQAEIENLSEDIKWGLKQQAKDSSSKLVNRKCYGYTHNESGHLVPHPAESKVVKQIFKWRVAKKSLQGIVNELYAKHVPSPSGKEKWNKEAINKILRNEKYIGEVLYQKTYVKDLFEGKQVKNDNVKDMYHHVCHHEAIVSREMFEKVQ